MIDSAARESESLPEEISSNEGDDEARRASGDFFTLVQIGLQVLVGYCALLAALDVGFALPNLPAIGALEFGLLWWETYRYLFLGGLPSLVAVASITAMLRTGGWLRALKRSPSDVLSLMIALVIAASSGRFAWALLDRNRIEFGAIISVYEWGVLAGVGLMAWLLELLIRGPLETAALLFPKLFSHRAVAAVVSLWITVTCVVTAHIASAPIYEHGITALLGSLATTFVLAAAFVVLPEPWRGTRRWIPVGALGMLLLSWPLTESPAARFALHGHVPLGGAHAVYWRTLSDWDGDGSTAWYWGGNDCAPADPNISPLTREKPGDQVDQDCRGGDAKVDQVLPRARLVPQCAVEEGQLDHIVLLTVDALRADTLTPELMPNLLRLGQQASVYGRAYPPSGSTEGSTLGIATGQTLSDIRTVFPEKDYFFSPSNLLVESVARYGFRTAVFIPFDVPPAVRRGAHIQRPKWLEVQPHGVKHLMASASLLGGTEALLKPTEKTDPTFVWIHLPDLHAPYPKRLLGRNDLSDYEQALIYVDAHIGLFLSSLEKSRVLERTAVIVSSDHGEQLGQRGREGHGTVLFEEGIHVPLIIHVPGCDRTLSRTPINLLGVRELVERLARPAPAPGTTNSPPFTVVEEGALSSLGLKRAIIGERYKLIHDVLNGGMVAFDLEQDPGELGDIFGSRKAELRSVLGYYQRWLDAESR